ARRCRELAVAVVGGTAERPGAVADVLPRVVVDGAVEVPVVGVARDTGADDRGEVGAGGVEAGQAIAGRGPLVPDGRLAAEIAGRFARAPVGARDRAAVAGDDLRRVVRVVGRRPPR